VSVIKLNFFSGFSKDVKFETCEALRSMSLLELTISHQSERNEEIDVF